VLPDLLFRSDIVDVDALALVDEEHATLCGVDDLHDLVLPSPEERRFLVQAVRLVGDQRREGVGFSLDEAASAGEQRIDLLDQLVASELLLVHLSRGRVLRDVLGHQIVLDQSC